MILYLDLETYSATDIRAGTYRYAADAEIMLFAYALDDGPARVWDRTETLLIPDDLAAALDDPEVILVAHNSMFDRSVLVASGHDLPIPRWRDTMVQALAHSLPGSLDALCEVLKVPTDKAKLKDGKALVHLFCKPRPKNMKLRRATRETHPEEWARFMEYAANDVEAMRVIHKKMPRWNYQGEELALWHLDQKINDRGVMVDLALARAAIEAVHHEQARLRDAVHETTAGAVDSATRRDAMLDYILMEYGVNLPDLQGSTVERIVDDPSTPPELRDLLTMRLQATTTSTSKYNAVVRGASNDGRLRGTLQFAGASRTARWAGRLFQPQNLPRPTMGAEEIEQCIAAIKGGRIDLVTDDVMAACSNAIRGVIVAPPGKKLVVADLANIEGRMAAWLAGEEWKLKAFLDYDAGTGPDLYKVAYAKAFNIKPDEVSKPQRQIGKVMELMLQYEGGVGAFLTGAAAYAIDLDAMAQAALPNVPDDVLDEARGFLDWTLSQGRNTFGLADDTFIACDALKRLWRRAHPAISGMWPALKDAVIEAIGHPGHWLHVRRVSVRRDGAWLKIRLPSGRLLCYPSPQVDEDGAITYMGVNQFNRKWCRLKTYGGKLLENITQAAARDILAGNMPMIDDLGYEIVLSVHDELITEAPDTPSFNADELAMLMSTAQSWSEGLPLAAAGFEAYRYRKD